MNIQEAKQIPIDQHLADLGISPAFEKKGELWYKSPFNPNEKTPSFHVTPSRRGWKDFSNGDQGGNIIDFAMQYFNVNSVSAALQEIERVSGHRQRQPKLFHQGATRASSPGRPASSPQASNNTGSAPIEITKEQAISHPALAQYLNKRGLSLGFARQYLKEIHFNQNGKAYFALGFPNDSDGYEIRNAYYQGSARTKNISSFNLSRLKYGENTLAIFEGFFDYLTAIYTRTISEQTPAIVLNTASFRGRALQAIPKDPAVSVELYLDHDDTGRALVAYFQERLPGQQVTDKSEIYKDYKDFNAQLEARNVARNHARN